MIGDSFGITILWVILFIFMIGMIYIFINMCYSFFKRDTQLLLPYYVGETGDIDLPE